MQLGFVYFEKENDKFKKELENYNNLVRSYFTNGDTALSGNLISSFDSLIKSSKGYEILSEKDADIYKVVVNFMANELNDIEIDKIKSQNTNESLKEKVVSRISKRLSSVKTEDIHLVIQKSLNLVSPAAESGVETIFVPSVIKTKDI